MFIAFYIQRITQRYSLLLYFPIRKLFIGDLVKLWHVVHIFRI
jgi:hypothetical protein